MVGAGAENELNVASSLLATTNTQPNIRYAGNNREGDAKHAREMWGRAASQLVLVVIT
jgi:hypothetical protein